jgi:hypothetical protein
LKPGLAHRAFLFTNLPGKVFIYLLPMSFIL